MTKTKQPNPPRGPKTVFHAFDGELGPSEHETLRWPEKVIALLSEPDVRLLLAWMALKPKIKERALKLIPKKKAKKEDAADAVPE